MALVKQSKQSSQVIDQREALNDDVFYSRAVTQVNNLVPISYDSIEVSYPSATEETYDYYQGGLSGLLVATLDVTYTDASKESVESVVRSFLLEA